MVGGHHCYYWYSRTVLIRPNTQNTPRNRFDRFVLTIKPVSFSVNGLSLSHQSKRFRSSCTFPSDLSNQQRFPKGFPICNACLCSVTVIFYYRSPFHYPRFGLSYFHKALISVQFGSIILICLYNFRVHFSKSYIYLFVFLTTST